MIEHLVLFKVKPTASSEQIKDAVAALKKMKSEIPGIEDISAGTNNSPEDKSHGYNFGLVVRFQNTNSRDEYITHPFHREVVEKFILPIVEDRESILVLDYDI